MTERLRLSWEVDECKALPTMSRTLFFSVPQGLTRSSLTVR